MRVPVLLPSSTWLSIWKTNNFQTCLSESDEHLIRFWKEVSSHPAIVNHPVKKIKNFNRRAVPLVLHGDGAAVTQQIGSSTKSCLFVSFRSLVAAREQHFLIAAIWTLACSKGTNFNTSRSLWRLVATDFDNMLWGGNEETGGYFPVVVFTTGDLEYYNEWHACPRWNANSPCSLCSVAKASLREFSAVADIPADTWQVPHEHPCPLFHRLLSPAAICPDYMHSKHLGVDLWLLGSVAWLLLFQVLTGDMPSRLEQLLHQLKALSRVLFVSLCFRFKFPWLHFIASVLAGILELSTAKAWLVPLDSWHGV
jgi:hypothetical protein